MWSDLRTEIDQARQRLQLSEQDFAPLPFTTNWAKLEENLYQVLCLLTTPPRARCGYGNGFGQAPWA